jgi:ABC-type transporter Mla subunit MlaD
MLGVVIGWIRDLNFQRTRSYQAIFEFPLACGIQVGTPVRIRGVTVGSVLSVRPSLEQVDVLVEVDDVNIKIPRNSLVEANQSGLIAETLIDVTPQKPLPKSKAGPLDQGCEAEGVIVCDRSRLAGRTGVSMDVLVAVCTRLALEVEQLGMARMWTVGEGVQQMLVDLAPLVKQAEAIAAEVRPLLGSVREGELLASVEKLAESAAATAADVRKLNSAILTEENTELLRQSVGTLTKMLQHVEAVSGDVASVTGDPATRQNLRQLIASLSRLVDN